MHSDNGILFGTKKKRTIQIHAEISIAHHSVRDDNLRSCCASPTGHSGRTRVTAQSRAGGRGGRLRAGRADKGDGSEQGRRTRGTAQSRAPAAVWSRGCRRRAGAVRLLCATLPRPARCACAQDVNLSGTHAYGALQVTVVCRCTVLGCGCGVLADV